MRIIIIMNVHQDHLRHQIDHGPNVSMNDASVFQLLGKGFDTHRAQ